MIQEWEIPIWLVVTGTMEFWMTFHILGIMILTDELIFFRGVETTNQFWIGMGEWDDYWKLFWIIPSFPTKHK